MISNQGITTSGPTLMIGNTMTPVQFAKNPSAFMNEWFAMGPTHHFAMSTGHNTSLFSKVAMLMNIQLESVC
jgi:L-arabinose isomerase